MRNILVIFQATTEGTEGMALALGLGAVQAGANIRLRHLDPSPTARLAHDGYGILQGADLRWAEGLAIFLEGNNSAGLNDLKSVLIQHKQSEDPNRKWAFVSGDQGALESISDLVKLLEQDGFAIFASDHDLREAAQQSFIEIGRGLAETPAQSIL